MVEIRTTIPALKRIVKETGNTVFESRGVAVSSIYGMIVLARKDKPEQVFPKSLPLRELGYSGIAAFSWGGIIREHLDEWLRAFVNSLTVEEKEALKNILGESEN